MKDPYTNTMTVLYLIKGIKNGCPCIVEIRGTQGCVYYKITIHSVN